MSGRKYEPSPLAMVNDPTYGRKTRRVPIISGWIRFTGVWVGDDSHPLGGYLGDITLYRRVNLRKDEVPQWIHDRPLYEFTKERPA